MFIFLCTIFHLGTAQLDVEIADTNSSRNRGLMFRETLSDTQGMLFIYEKPEILSFWMKNTYIPLSIGFFDTDQILMQIDDMEPTTSISPPIYKSIKPAKFALEVSKNWFKKNKISIGDKFTLSVE
ncbi:MAG TPA: DUF192 domain-containing protein [Chlamydiales bacterium]|nr:DUF192 domain-containing protein [Chlamydiales bacterium]